MGKPLLLMTQVPAWYRLNNMLKFNQRSYTRILFLFIILGLSVLMAGCGSFGFETPLQDLIIQPEATPPGSTVEGQSDETADLVEAEETFILIEEIIIILLFIASIVGIAARRIRVPYTLGLVVIGLLITLLPQVNISIPPTLIFALLIPPIVFEGAFHLNINDLRRDLRPILIFAIPGVILTMGIVASLVSWGTGIPITYALVFGAIVAAIDPVAVISLFRNLGVPKRLQVLLEGESLLNDGTSIVIYGLVLSVAVSASEFNLLTSVLDFIRIAGGGIVIGLALGALISQIIDRIDDYLIETTLTTILAFGSFLIAEQVFHVSGVLAVVGAGLIAGNIGPAGMSPTTRIVLFNFWEYAAFLANSFIFLLIGLQIELSALYSSWQLIAIAIIAVLIARTVTIYGFAWIGREIPLRWQHILNWGGLRGAISLALALSLPLVLGDVRSQLQIMTFGVVIFTLLVQGLSIGTLVRKLRISERSAIKEEFERRHARAIASQTSYEHLEQMRQNGLISSHTWQMISPLLDQYNQVLIDATKEVLTNHPELEAEDMEIARRESLQAQRSTLSTLLNDGVISEETYVQLVSEVDAALASDIISWPELIRQQSGVHLPITRLLGAVIQEQDLENALSVLSKMGFSVTHLPSTGGFLGRRSVTLLIGLAEGQEKTAVDALSSSCKKRVEYVSTPIDIGPSPFPNPIPVNVGGATIFVFEVDRYEEF
ncbi:MAG: Na+/H+ antiporter [Chloroflexota bacterium]|nr:MAG: Na+/H+ antiporter [Chloroflexota bacterium]